MSYKLIVMGFDGQYQTEGEFNSVSEAWDRSNDMGSRWYFYPWHFVLSESGKTIASAPDMLQRFKGKKLSTVIPRFSALSKMIELENADVDTYTMAL
jgi:hypothetical protein